MAEPAPPPRPYVRITGSLSRRMIFIAAAWIMLLLSGGGFALDRVLTSAVTRNFDDQLEYLLNSMMVSAQIASDGGVVFNRPLGDQRFLEPYSGLYWQVSGKGFEPFVSRSLWDRLLKVDHPYHDMKVHEYDSGQFPDQKLRVVERDLKLPGSTVIWRFQVAQDRQTLDEQINAMRRTIVRSFLVLGLGLIFMVVLQTWYGLIPLRKLRIAIARLRAGEITRIEGEMPSEVAPMVEELNALVAHNDRQAEEARRHAGNLAHALKTPLTVIMNAASAQSGELSQTVVREARTMRRQVDHHLARARAVGRRGSSHSRADVSASVEAVERAVSRLYPHVRIDTDSSPGLVAHIERQDLEEILGNLVENAAKYGGGSVFITARAEAGFVEIMVEDDGPGVPEPSLPRLTEPFERLEPSRARRTGGVGLGLSIVQALTQRYRGDLVLENRAEGGFRAILLLRSAGGTGPA